MMDYSDNMSKTMQILGNEARNNSEEWSLKVGRAGSKKIRPFRMKRPFGGR